MELVFVGTGKKLLYFLLLSPPFPLQLPLFPPGLLLPRWRKGLLHLFHTILLPLPYTQRPGLLPTPLLTLWLDNQNPLLPNRQFLLPIPQQFLDVQTHHIHSSHVALSLLHLLLLLLLLTAKVPKRPAATALESTAGKRVNRSPCRLCPVAYSNLPLHSKQFHLPWFFNPDSVCWRCRG